MITTAKIKCPYVNGEVTIFFDNGQFIIKQVPRWATLFFGVVGKSFAKEKELLRFSVFDIKTAEFEFKNNAQTISIVTNVDPNESIIIKIQGDNSCAVAMREAIRAHLRGEFTQEERPIPANDHDSYDQTYAEELGKSSKLLKASIIILVLAVIRGFAPIIISGDYFDIYSFFRFFIFSAFCFILYLLKLVIVTIKKRICSKTTTKQKAKDSQKDEYNEKKTKKDRKVKQIQDNTVTNSDSNNDDDDIQVKNARSPAFPFFKTSISKIIDSAKKHRSLLKKGLFIALIIFAVHTTLNCVLAVNASDNQEFIKAKRHQDLVIGYGLMFPEQRAYVKAGVLLEQGKYFEAYNALLRIKKKPVPITVTDKAKNGIYIEAQNLYRSGDWWDIEIAQSRFELISDYNRSADYLKLIKARNSSAFSLSLYNDIFEMLDFEDAGDVILMHNYTAIRFLKGVWKSTSGKQFRINSDNSVNFNLPHYNSYDREQPYIIENGIYKMGYYTSWGDQKFMLFKFTIINEDKIRVYCYKDGSTHVLIRQ